MSEELCNCTATVNGQSVEVMHTKEECIVSIDGGSQNHSHEIRQPETLS